MLWEGSSIPTRVRNIFFNSSNTSLGICSSIPTRVRNSMFVLNGLQPVGVPAYLQGFETDPARFQTFEELLVPAYLQGFETRGKDFGIQGSQRFQHTYKGSKLIRSPQQRKLPARSSIPTRVRNLGLFIGAEMWEKSSSIPTRVRN